MVIEEPGWRERGYEPFNPRGVVAHHTGPGSTDGLIRLCINGRRDLRGPLANVVLDPDGVAHVIAAGRANHAGAGSWRGLSGNSSVFGIEAVHSGVASQAWPDVQVKAYYRVVAALLDLLGAPADMACGHKEWAPRRKPDPVTLSMAAFRDEVASLLRSRQAPAEVRPLFSPPLRLEPIVAYLKDPESGGFWMLAESGAIYAFEAPYHGGANERPYFAGRKAARLDLPNENEKATGKKYVIVSNQGQRYAYPV